MELKPNATQEAITLIPKILKKFPDQSFSFSQIFDLLVHTSPDIFLDEFDEPRYGVLRGIVSRYQAGNLFLQNTHIYKDSSDLLQFKYSTVNFFSCKKNYKLYISTQNYLDIIESSLPTFEEFMNFNDEEKQFIDSVMMIRKDLHILLENISWKEN